MLEHCPICGSNKINNSVSRASIPTLQNRVYSNVADAVTCGRGQLVLGCCEECGFAFNRTFDSKLVDYDQNYDNDVPSSVMDGYYDRIADELYSLLPLAEGLVVDIGCGKGQFLRQLTKRYPDVRALGVDPSYEPLDQDGSQANLCFINDYFDGGQLNEEPALIVCRHVLEHIPEPIPFLREIVSNLDKYPSIPIFLEVPDCAWIVDNHAFWDFYYEHCNYFTGESLANLCAQAGLDLESVNQSFNGQYLQTIAKTKSEIDKPSITLNSNFAEKLTSYSIKENENISSVLTGIKNFVQQGKNIAIWGMASKGVIYSILLGEAVKFIDLAVDINTSKQGLSAPITALVIKHPAELSKKMGEWVIIVMNPNYAEEIRRTCHELDVPTTLVDPFGRPL